ncbi:hypothetical protein IFM12276_32770 [Nocardia sputorum]|uniref:Uncharacterized protein n=1 Tax=Nocardia sputorum TaxID=2984338 RepID=A0ABM8CZ07_9NOCA|nr:hypothetical protein IFM12276_32770 [Nocardia sputorum]
MCETHFATGSHGAAGNRQPEFDLIADHYNGWSDRRGIEDCADEIGDGGRRVRVTIRVCPL